MYYNKIYLYRSDKIYFSILYQKRWKENMPNNGKFRTEIETEWNGKEYSDDRKDRKSEKKGR